MIEIRGIKVPILNSIEKLEAQITKKLRIKQVPEYVIVQSENLAVSLTSLRVQMKNRKAEEQTEMDQVI